MVILSFMTANNSTNIASIAQVKRSAITTPSPLTPLPFTSNSVVTNTVIKTLKDFIGHENHTSYEHRNIGELVRVVLTCLSIVCRDRMGEFGQRGVHESSNCSHGLLDKVPGAVLVDQQVSGYHFLLPTAHQRLTHAFGLRRDVHPLQGTPQIPPIDNS
jgi:hypothetical protein